MRWLVLLLVGGCIVHDRVQTLAHWQGAPSSYDIGCVTAAPFVRKTGKDGVGISLRLKSHGDCVVAIGKSQLHFVHAGIVDVSQGGQRYELKGNSVIDAWLPMLFDDNEAWNDGRNRAELFMEVQAGGIDGRVKLDMTQDGGDGTNAVGIANLGEPMKFEKGDPTKFEEAAEPDWWSLDLWAMPYFLWGHGREHASIASRETGIDLHFEGATNRYAKDASWGITATVPFAQWGPNRHTDALGALGLEVDYRWTFFDAGVGPATYLSSTEMGVQASIRFPFGMFRMRYMATSGIEVLAGFQLPFPMVYARSK